MKKIEDMTLREKIGQMICFGFSGEVVNDQVRENVKDYKIGNFILFASNCKNNEQIFNLNRDLNRLTYDNTGIMPIINLDQEGGMVTRIFNEATFFPGAMTISRTQNPSYAYQVGINMTKELLSLGFNMNLAPSIDINNNANNPVIGVRSYSDKKEEVALYANEFIKALKEEKIISTAKHFPGHGDTTVDSHLALPKVSKSREEIYETELYPFKKAIEAGVDAIMSAHIVFDKIDPDKPATLSKPILTDILRKELKFEGIIITDSMEMNAIKDIYGSLEGCVLAIKAGADMLCLTHTKDLPKNVVELLEQKVLTNEISEERINESVRRILNKKEEIFKKYFETFLSREFTDVREYLLNKPNKELSQIITDQSLTLVKGNNFELNNKKTLLINTKSIALTIADDEGNNASIAVLCEKEIPSIDTITLENKPTDEEINKVQEMIKAYDQVIYVTYNLILNNNQQKLLDKLLPLKDKLTVISTRLPYDLHYSNKITNYVCVYEYTPNAVRTVISYLQGKIKPQGKPLDNMYE